MTITLLLGGARSGKSRLAVELGTRHRGPVTYVATAPLGDGHDLDDRIRRHRAERPAAWATIEATREVMGALQRAAGSLVILDCLTLWVSNLSASGASGDEIERRSTDAARYAADRGERTVVVSNEVGLGVHPPTVLGREYRDLLGRVNQTWASMADDTLFLAAGRAVRLEDPLTLLT